MKKLFLVCLLLIFSVYVTADVKAAESKVVERDLSSYFTGYTGTFVLYDEADDTYIIYNNKQAEKRLPPCSTFKIYNSLVGLETGVIADENFVLKWDGTEQFIKSWEKDQSLQEAFTNSAVWYYKDLSYFVGQKNMQSYYEKLEYGNNDFSDDEIFSNPRGSAFWLDSSLQISAQEQVVLLTRLYNYDLPFSHRSVDIVKKIMVLQKNAAYTFSGKTGSNMEDGRWILGWFVGSVEKEGKRYYFAVNIEAMNAAIGSEAKNIAINILKDMGILI